MDIPKILEMSEEERIKERNRIYYKESTLPIKWEKWVNLSDSEKIGIAPQCFILDKINLDLPCECLWTEQRESWTRVWLSKNIGDKDVENMLPYLLILTRDFKIFSFTNNIITSRGVTLLSSILPHYYRLEKLCLSGNNIETDEIHILGPALKNLTTLKELQLSNNLISDNGAANLCLYIKKMTSLKWLCMKGTSITDQGILELASHCPASFERLYAPRRTYEIPIEMTMKMKKLGFTYDPFFLDPLIGSWKRGVS